MSAVLIVHIVIFFIKMLVTLVGIIFLFKEGFFYFFEMVCCYSIFSELWRDIRGLGLWKERVLTLASDWTIMFNSVSALRLFPQCPHIGARRLLLVLHHFIHQCTSHSILSVFRESISSLVSVVKSEVLLDRVQSLIDIMWYMQRFLAFYLRCLPFKLTLRIEPLVHQAFTSLWCIYYPRTVHPFRTSTYV